MSDATPTELPPSLGRLLERADFNADRLQLIAKAWAASGEQPFIGDVERANLLEGVRSAIAPGSDLWVFGYGSLMWNPAIKTAESRKARISGYTARFCLSIRMGRGTKEQPGLMLGLDEGESCIGMAHRVAAEDVDSELTVLWFREMFSGAYLPVWVDAEMDGGKKQRAMTFAVNRKNPRYEGILNEETIARRIALAEGFIGTNRDYLFRTVSHLNEIGVTDGPLHSLAARVTELTKEGNRL